MVPGLRKGMNFKDGDDQGAVGVRKSELTQTKPSPTQTRSGNIHSTCKRSRDRSRVGAWQQEESPIIRVQGNGSLTGGGGEFPEGP